MRINGAPVERHTDARNGLASFALAHRLAQSGTLCRDYDGFVPHCGSSGALDWGCSPTSTSGVPVQPSPLTQSWPARFHRLMEQQAVLECRRR